jgi:Family of unknown function (DUF6308)
VTIPSGCRRPAPLAARPVTRHAPGLANPHTSGNAVGTYSIVQSLATDNAVRAAALRLRAGLALPGLGRAVAAYFAEPEFAGMTFADLGRNPPFEIVPDDLLAVTLLDITWRPQVVRALLGTHNDRFSQMLAGLPQATDLWEASHETMNRIDAMWDGLIAIEGIGTASASKLLARKRPRLCPISDSVVIKTVDAPGRTWDVLRCLLQDQAARDDVEALRPAAAAGASLLRILDVAIWVSRSRSAAAHQVRAQAGMTAAA